MSEEHTDNLKKARARLIEQRRAFVKVLAGPYERGKTEQARERFFEMQIAIADDNASNKGHCDGVAVSGKKLRSRGNPKQAFLIRRTLAPEPIFG